MDSVGNVVKGGSNLVSHQNTFTPRLPENREEKWSKQLDDTNIQIKIDSDSESIPVEASSDARSNIGVEKSHLKRELYAYALNNTWHRAKSIYDEFPDMVRIPLTATGDTALHVAVSAKSTTFLKELVTLMKPEDLEIPNVDGNTAFCIAAITGNGDVFQIMIDKNENLPIIPDQDGMLPVHLAALTGYHEIVQHLSTDDLLQKMDFKDIQQLFFMIINSNMYDVAMKLVEKYPEKLVVARCDKDQQTALHMMARKPSEEFYIRENNNKLTLSGWGHQLELLQKVWFHVRQLEYKKIMELITHPSVVLFDAVKSGNVEAVKWILYMNPELLTIRDPENRRNLLHFAVLYRQRSLFDFLLKMGTVNLVIRAVDKDRNNVLHFAAYPQSEETSISSRPNILMAEEFLWIKEVEKNVPPELRTMRNSDGKTPWDIFNAKHMKLYEEFVESAKGTANSGMVVATLVATVAFAAALTVPGHKSGAAFTVFILTNAVALFTSSASIVSFLSIFTSSRPAGGLSFFRVRHSVNVIIISLHPFLVDGLAFLFISIATMVMAFASACFLIFDQIHNWVAYVVASLGLLPILLFVRLHYSVRDGLLYHIDHLFWPILYHLSKFFLSRDSEVQ